MLIVCVFKGYPTIVKVIVSSSITGKNNKTLQGQLSINDLILWVKHIQKFFSAIFLFFPDLKNFFQGRSRFNRAVLASVPCHDMNTLKMNTFKDRTCREIQ